jgi:hypothetical protein
LPVDQSIASSELSTLGLGDTTLALPPSYFVPQHRQWRRLPQQNSVRLSTGNKAKLSPVVAPHVTFLAFDDARSQR